MARETLCSRFLYGERRCGCGGVGKDTYFDREKQVWGTDQKGPVGRMSTEGLDKILYRIEGEYSVQPFGQELVAMLKEAYLDSPDIQTGDIPVVA